MNMADTQNLTNDIIQSTAVPENNPQLSEDISKVIRWSHGKIADIVDIRALESWETSISWIFSRKWKETIYNLVWIKFDPKVYEIMTDTLNKHRQQIENWIADNYNTKAANDS